MSLQFLSQTGHFALNLFAALVFFATFWLYFDAWLIRKENKELIKWIGCLILSLSFILHATVIEQSVFGSSVFGQSALGIAVLVRLIGYVAMVIGQLIDPLQPIPELGGLKTEQASVGQGWVTTKIEDSVPTPKETRSKKATATKKTKTAIILNLSGLATALSQLQFVLPVASFVLGSFYLHRVVKGLEKHLRPIAIAFLVLAGAELLSLASFLRGSSNLLVHNLSASFGPIWFIEHVTLLIAVLILGRWIWRYLLTRLQTQLIMLFTAATMVIFLLTTVGFTYLIFRNIEQESLANLTTAVNVLDFALVSKKNETLSVAETLADNPDVITAVVEKNHDKLATLTTDFLKTKKQSILIITTADGQVLLRADNPARWGDSISENLQFKRASIGTASSSVTTQEGVVATNLAITSVTPVRDSSNTIVGVVFVGVTIDNAFVDGIKKATGLDTAVYADNVRSATTFIASDGKSRLIGIKQENEKVKQQVLKEGKIFRGSIKLLNTPYLSVYAPLKDVDNTIVGMLFVGKPSISLLATASRSIESTFLIAAVILVISVFPSRLMAKYVSYQVS